MSKTAAMCKNFRLTYLNKVDASNFRTGFRSDLNVSSVGFGTYYGTPDESDDLKVSSGMYIQLNLMGDLRCSMRWWTQ